MIANSLSKLLSNLPEGIHRVECKFRHDDKKCKTYEIKYNYYACFLECTNFKDYLIDYKCLCCNKNHKKSLMKN